MSRCTVLVAEDEVPLLDSLSFILTQEGYDVLVARDGTEALAALNDGRVPDVIVLDLVMPGLSGFSLNAHLKRDPALAHVKVVAISGYFDRGCIEADAFLKKPIDLDALLGAIRGVAPSNR